MNMQRIAALTKKELKKTVREPAVLFMIFLFPVVFVVAFGASFGGFGGSTQANYQIGVVNLDGRTNSQMLINALGQTQIVTTSVYDNNATAQADLSQGKMQAIIVIPESFSGSVTSYYANPADAAQWTNSTLKLYLDKGSLVATQAIPPIVEQTVQAMFNQHQTQTPVNLTTASLVEVKQTSALDFIAPGMFTFASIFLIMMVAQSFTQDRENGMMKRIRISPISATEFMTGLVISYAVIAVIQAGILFGITYALGFRPDVDGAAYAFTFAMVLIFSVSNIGFGLITATIAKSSSAATGLSFLFVLPQLFLGTFVSNSLAGAAQSASLIVPSHYVTDALTSMFLRGAAITSTTVLIDLGVVCASCIGILAVGIVLYGKYYKI
jgi:ABC-2 type transport system permease protein